MLRTSCIALLALAVSFGTSGCTGEKREKISLESARQPPEEPLPDLSMVVFAQSVVRAQLINELQKKGVVCPDCARNLYPEYWDQIKDKVEK